MCVGLEMAGQIEHQQVVTNNQIKSAATCYERSLSAEPIATPIPNSRYANTTVNEGIPRPKINTLVHRRDSNDNNTTHNHTNMNSVSNPGIRSSMSTNNVPHDHLPRSKTFDHVTFSPQLPRVKKISAPTNVPFNQTHRRVRSGDSYTWNKIPASRQQYDNYRNRPEMSTSGRTPPLHPTGLNLPSQYQAAGSSNQNIPRINSANHAYAATPPIYSQQPMDHNRPLYINIPVDPVEEHQPTESYMYHTPDKQNRYLKQVNSFMKLNQAIKQAEELYSKLEKEVRDSEDELNSRSAIEKNPTEKDFRRIKEENEYLMKEIRDMHAEMDRCNISYPGDPPGQVKPPQRPPAPTFDTSGFPYDITGPDNSVVNPFKSPVVTHSPSTPNLHSSNIITTQPMGASNHQRTSAYENVPDNPLMKRHEKPLYQENIYETPPPPVPPRVPNEPEKWRCPTCTFDNLLLSECEMCGSARPYSINRI